MKELKFEKISLEGKTLLFAKNVLSNTNKTICTFPPSTVDDMGRHADLSYRSYGRESVFIVNSVLKSFGLDIPRYSIDNLEFIEDDKYIQIKIVYVKTVLEHFEKLPEPYRTKGISFVSDNFFRNKRVKTLQEAVHSIDWKYAPDGIEYWEKFCNSLIK